MRALRSLWFVALAAVPLAFLTVFFAWPVVALFVTGFVGESGAGGGVHYGSGAGGGGAADVAATAALASGPLELLFTPRNGRALGNTLLQAAVASLVAVLLGVPAGYALYRLRFPGRGLLRGALTVPFVLPSVVVGAAFIAVFGSPSGVGQVAGGVDGAAGGAGGESAVLRFAVVVAALVFPNIGVVARTVGGFWERLDERQVQAARSLGATPAQAFWLVTLPALAPAITSAFAIVFMFCATSFATVLMLGGPRFSNIETEIYRSTVQFLDLRSAAVLAVVQLLLVALSLGLTQLLRRAGERAVVLRATPRAPRSPQLRDAPLLLITGATVTLLIVWPLATVVLRSLRGPHGELTLANYANLLNPPAELRLSGTGPEAVWLSLRLALMAALLAVALGLAVSIVLSRRPRSRLLRVALTGYDALMMLPLGVSAVTVGFGLLLTMHRPLGIGVDLRTSTVLIPIAQALVALPIVVRLLLPVLRGIGEELHQAAAACGARGATIFWLIDFPLLGRSLGLAFGFALAVSLGEFGATSFLVRPGEETLPVLVAKLTGQQVAGSYGAGFAAAVVLGLVSTLALLASESTRVPHLAGAFGPGPVGAGSGSVGAEALGAKAADVAAPSRREVRQ